MRRKLPVSTRKLVAKVATAFQVQTAQPDHKDPRAHKAPKEIAVSKVLTDYRAKLDHKENRVFKDLLDLRVLLAQMELTELLEKPAPQVRRASKVLPVQLELPARRAKLDLWVLWDPKDLKVKSVLLDLQVQMEHRVRRVKWALRVLWARLVLRGLLAQKAIRVTRV